MAEAELELRTRQERQTFSDWLPKTSPQYNWGLRHLAYMQPTLNDIANGKTNRIMFFLPPQHGKSTQNTIHFAAYYLYKNPNKNVIVCSYNQKFARKFSNQIKNLYSKYRNIPKTVTNTADYWETGLGGSLTSVGRKAGLAGYPADLIIGDDLIKNPLEAYSEVIREETSSWWDMVTEARAHNNTSFLFSITRWHTQDLAGHILQHDSDLWTVFKFPALAGKNDLLGREEGESLWPEKFSRELFLRRKAKISAARFLALYQQEPTDEEGNFIKVEWFDHYQVTPIFKRTFQCWDTAFKVGKENDYSVCFTIGESVDAFYLLDMWRGRLLFPDLKRQMVALADKHKPSQILVEDKASGQDLVPSLRDTNLPIIPVAITKDKVARATLASDLIQAKKIKIPERAPWLADFLCEIAAFPNGDHDDIVDALTLGINKFYQKSELKIYQI